MYKKIEELLPCLLRKLSNGESISVIELQDRYNFSSSSIRAHLRSLRDNFFKKDIKYDASTKRWIAVKSGFLNKILLKPEEIVVLNSILRNQNRLGKSLSKHTKELVENYLKRTRSYIFKQKNSEKIDKDMEEKFALIHSAIDEKKKLYIRFANTKRVFYPYKVVNIEYYWYLLGFEESKDDKQDGSCRIKSFALAKIQDIKILDDEFEYDFSNLDKKIEHIMNAYFSLENPITTVRLLVNEEIIQYIDRAQFFDSWTKEKYQTMVKDKRYARYEVGTSDKNFRDIVPTILKYLPNILIEEPEELKDEIMRKLDEYKYIYKS